MNINFNKIDSSATELIQKIKNKISISNLVKELLCAPYEVCAIWYIYYFIIHIRYLPINIKKYSTLSDMFRK
jgi:hypothetical protein